MKNRFNISVSEVEGHDYHQTAVLGLAVASPDAAHADAQLQAAISLVASMAEIAGVSTELINL